MPGLLNSSSIMMCPHGGMVQAATSNTHTEAAGDFLLRSSDTFLISACPFILGLVPHPCVQVQWVQPAARSKAAGDFTLTEGSVGLCLAADMAPQGTVIIAFTQPRVAGL
jgi:hypothetical protein